MSSLYDSQWICLEWLTGFVFSFHVCTFDCLLFTLTCLIPLYFVYDLYHKQYQYTTYWQLPWFASCNVQAIADAHQLNVMHASYTIHRQSKQVAMKVIRTFSLSFLHFSWPLESTRRLYGFGFVGSKCDFLNSSTKLRSGIGWAWNCRA